MTMVKSSSILNAWMSAFELLLGVGIDFVMPLTVEISINKATDCFEIPNILDEALFENGCYSCNSTANTIFPRSLWKPGIQRQEFFERYKKLSPQLKRADRNNRLGMYFERLIDYRQNKTKQSDKETKTFNQLDFIINTYRRGNTRRSALQASIFNPFKDLNNSKQWGFPCLQHVFFTPCHKSKTLTVTGVYATQHIFDRAYGNYLGLYRLGEFMAYEMNLTMNKVVCITSQAKLGKITKAKGRILLGKMQSTDKQF